MNFAELQSRRNEIYAIADKYGISNIRVFGSVARGEADIDSDVDLLVNMQDGKSLFDMMSFRNETEELLRHEVDVVEIDAVKNPLRLRYILKDAKFL